ncbi:MAG: hypothetical protein QOE72_4141 [Chloroflexota bacterium]|nr:hypothetical protein [Chloroflexota bacterium]
MSCAVADRSRRRERTADLPREPLAALPETVAPAPLSTECREAVRALVAQIELRIDGLADRMAREIQTAIPEVDQGPGLLEATRASCRANLIIVFGRMREGVDPNTGGVPAEALEYVLAFVRQGVSLATLLRTYRIGHALVLRTLLDLAVERLGDRTVLGHVVQHCNWYTYAYVDAVSDALTREYTEERERWVRSAAAFRADTVRALLDGRLDDPQEGGRRLRYALARWHAAFVVWGDAGDVGPPGQAALERVGMRCAAELGAVDALLVPLGPELVAGWMGLARDLDLRRLDGAPFAQGEAPSARIALGSPGRELEGFRRSHAEALLARRVARLVGRPAGTATHYDDVALLALLTEDLDHARRFVTRELGPLASDDEATRRIVATLGAYFAEGTSPARVSRRLGVHENTVTYRLRRAEELLGRSLTDRTAELIAALTLLDAVGCGAGAPRQ